MIEPERKADDGTFEYLLPAVVTSRLSMKT